MKKQSKGITLIALVITIVILLILAGLSISALTGRVLFTKSEEAKEKSEEAKIKENLTLAEYESTINGYIDGSRDTVTIDKESYEALISKVNSLETRLIQVESGNSNQTQIETGTYVGTGTYGSENKNSITFSKAPKLVFLATDACYYEESRFSCMRIITGGSSMDSGTQYSYENHKDSGIGAPIYINWTNNNKEMHWYANYNEYDQMNQNGIEYTWFAIYE